ncbi:protein cereblon-like [Aricia agestis]|uniref:protein cereblon-like n=1 Tax=Aricia agestis TaxID=91739 RepID=UPI001C2042B6|nr:protein cereblon-like [Aricia agestis]
MDENVSSDGDEEIEDTSSLLEDDERETIEENDEGEGRQFDISLAATHSYMGSELLPVSGRSVLEAGWEGKVPVTIHHGVVFPGETVPMLIGDQHDAAMLVQVIEEDKLFGLLCPDDSGTKVSGYGVLCEVFEATPAIISLKVKARAIHRFRFVDMPKPTQPRINFYRMQMVKVRVLPELQRGDPLHHARLASLDALRHSNIDSRLRSMDASVTPWPLFVYEIFNYQRMREIIKDYFKSVSLCAVPEDPVSLSFWTASNLALSARERLALFRVDDALLRLHMEVRFITRKSVLCCTSCAAEIARREHIFAMSSEGVHSNYTNLGGYMHDVVTVSRATNTQLSGAPSAEFSWFPGYTWTIAHCHTCMAHVGWRFDAQERSLRPQRFYGLCRNYVQPLPPPDDALQYV